MKNLNYNELQQVDGGGNGAWLLGALAAVTVVTLATPLILGIAVHDIITNHT